MILRPLKLPSNEPTRAGRGLHFQNRLHAPRCATSHTAFPKTSIETTRAAQSETLSCLTSKRRGGRFRKTIFRRIPFDKVNWTTSSFLIGTFLLSLTLVPAYLWQFGIDWFQVALFMVCACGFSITIGYHRLFSHLAFRAHWSVRLFALVFGAGAFENSVLLWACEHRAHHKAC